MKYEILSKLYKKYSIYLILLLASGLRLYQLGVRDFWYDEAFTGIAVKESWSGMMKMIMADVHPPFYYLSLKFFAPFFDYSVAGIRLYSAIFGILCVLAVYLLAKELFGRRAALFAGFIAAISPFAVQYSQEGRMYSMFAFFILIAGYFLIRELRITNNESRKYKYSILFGIFLGLSILTHYVGVIFIPIFYLVYVANKFPVISSQLPVNKKQLFTFLKSVLPDKNIVLGFVTSLLIFSPWIPNFINHLVKNATSNSLDWIRPANLGDIPVNIQMFIFGTPLGEMSSGMPGPNEFYGISDISAWVLVTIFLTLVVVYLMRKSKKTKEIATIIALSIGFMALVWLIGFFGKYFFVARYLLPAGYFIFILLGYWLSRIRLPYSALAITTYVILLFTTIPLGYSQGWNIFAKDFSKYDNNDFYILNSFDYVIAKYYIGADRLTLYNVDWPPYNPDYWAAIGKSLKRTENFEDLRNNKNALIISNIQLEKEKRSDRTFDPAGLQLVAQYKNILIYKFQ